MRHIKLTYKSPMFGSASCQDLESFSLGCIDLNPEMLEQLHDRSDELEQFLKRNTEDLVDCIPEDLEDLVVKAVFGNFTQADEGMCFLTEIYVREEPNHLQHDRIRNWITGQMSDGWGEGLEQREFMEEDVDWNQPAFDEDECVWSQEEFRATVSYYIHPWVPDKFYLDLIEDQIVELDIPEPNRQEFDPKEIILQDINTHLVQLLRKLDEMT